MADEIRRDGDGDSISKAGKDDVPMSAGREGTYGPQSDLPTLGDRSSPVSKDPGRISGILDRLVKDPGREEPVQKSGEGGPSGKNAVPHDGTAREPLTQDNKGGAELNQRDKQLKEQADRQERQELRTDIPGHIDNHPRYFDRKQGEANGWWPFGTKGQQEGSGAPDKTAPTPDLKPAVPGDPAVPNDKATPPQAPAPRIEEGKPQGSPKGSALDEVVPPV